MLPLAWLLLASTAVALSSGQDGRSHDGRSHDVPKPAGDPAVRDLGRTSPLHLNSAESLYLQLRTVGLDKSRVFRLRDVPIDKAAFHITLNDGTIAFTEDVAGRVTGAFFEGDGEILLSPPNQYERASMALFTGGAILEERFATAYFRFNDNTFAELLPSLMPVDDAPAFVSQWNETARNLAESDALRLLMTFSRFLPGGGQLARDTAMPVSSGNNQERFLHVRLQGLRLGTFDLYFDADASEQIWAGQFKTVEGASYYDVWTSFSSLETKAETNGSAEAVNATVGEGGKPDSIAISHYKIRAGIKPPTQIDAEALLQLEVRQGGQRAVAFELSRSLQITQVEADGHPVEFIHNPAIEGTQRARQGNDLVAIVFPQPLRTGQRLELRFVYGGEVLSEAGAGLLYVGARGTWYPNRGLVMSNFDLEFHYPAGWTLVATGKRTDAKSSPNPGDLGAARTPPAGEQVSRWVSERPIPIAGFDLGKYERVVAHAGDVTVETYATSGVERGFPKPVIESVIPDAPVPGRPRLPLAIAPLLPSPARNAQTVAAASAHAIEFFSRRYGPFPYGDLKLVQMPGGLSQGWPGLIFLSSMSFLTAEEKSQLHLSPVERTLVSQVIAHETAHQWWGDLVMWSGYRDQWIVEALANYSSLMVLESENPAQFRAAMQKFRDDLLEKNKSGVRLMEDGPVTLGTRLSCSQFPSGYDAISYGRGTWLFHMLRFMMRDAERTSGAGVRGEPEEPFVRVLRRIRERYQGKPITTRELLQAFEEELPPSLWYEHHRSLDWFYEGWVNGTAIPRFELHGVKYSDKPGSTTISGIVLQKDAPDNLVTSVPLYASVAGKMVLLGRVFADGAETSFHLSASPGARKVVLDPDQTLLARSR
ncbi:MAG TPA: M1 family aminopeptidase [Terriglobales bacterium]|nr:M1 family aminopeptidase [Terriglobales bacterium]